MFSHCCKACNDLHCTKMNIAGRGKFVGRGKIAGRGKFAVMGKFAERGKIAVKDKFAGMSKFAELCKWEVEVVVRLWCINYYNYYCCSQHSDHSYLCLRILLSPHHLFPAVIGLFDVCCVLMN